MREEGMDFPHARLRASPRIVFVEDFDMNSARHRVQGVDVWSNNPRRPLEASGTSGQWRFARYAPRIGKPRLICH